LKAKKLAEEIATESAARAAQDNSLSIRINNEESNRAAAVDILSDVISDEVSNRAAAVDILSGVISVEETNRTADVESLSTVIGDEVSSLIVADNNIVSTMTTEATRLQGEINGKLSRHGDTGHLNYNTILPQRILTTGVWLSHSLLIIQQDLL
jgi:hypothetical protein